MQILPTSISSNQTLWNAASNNRPDDEHASSFLDVLNSSLKAVEESEGEAANPFQEAKSAKSAHSSSAATATKMIQERPVLPAATCKMPPTPKIGA